MEYKKVVFHTLFKTYFIMNVNKECFDNSPSVENIGWSSAIKIKDNNHLNFMLNELQQKGFKNE